MSGESPDHGGGESPADHRPARRPSPAPPGSGWGRPIVSEHTFPDPPPPRVTPTYDDGESPKGGESPY